MTLILRLLVAFALAVLPLSGFAQEAATEQAAPRAAVIDFQSEAQVNELAAAGKTVVFFYAAWCPNCRATITELNARFDEVDPDLTLVIADYDKEAALKGKFGVTYQDTFVLLDAQGNGVKSWNSGGVDGLNSNSAS
ncbi:Thiol-disulfide isomerase or thioredoxin [Devosia sp. YR412]|uniref:TlpA family protein disulfide reductase n=1 Tax=Devosia sp. YR412 TaxID=1881030 RepID=UPI0008B40A64|nr:thioredoxin family protein [Devosia sp. YR412]SEQ54318.1 Thiol-disulfide isomerase or thioredoxin [Devosia sp. YR412]